jgi:hypothetical protein
MVESNLSRHRAGPVGVPALTSLLAVLFLTAVSVAAQGAGAGKIDFSPSLLPKIPTSLPLLRMSVQSPRDPFLTDVITRMGFEKTAIRELGAASPQMKGVVQQGRVLAYWHEQTGDAEILPQLEQLKTERYIPGNNPHAETALSTARTIFARPDVLPKDVTTIELTPVKPLVGVTLEKGAESAHTLPPALLYLNYVAAHRTVQGLAVQGPGSRALVGIDNSGTVQALSLHWRVASNSGQAEETRSPAQIHSALQAVVAPLAREGNVEVLAVNLVYYDDNQSPQMGPVYRIAARVYSNQGKGPAADDGLVLLYAQYGNAPLPPALTQGGPEPQAAPVNRGSLASGVEVAPGDPTVGVYVIRNAEGGWLSDAQGFIGGLGAWNSGGQFTLAQYYWAQPFMYHPNASSWVDSVQVAETEGHGDWWHFTTDDQNWSTEDVNFDTFPNGAGYGSVNKGKLNYWILHGCEEIPSPEDTPCPQGSPHQDNRSWTDPWWRIFQGLHTVVGYRTVMWINDGVGQPFATSIKNGTPVISAWFNALESSSAYNPDANYVNHCGLNWPMGRPAAVTACGHNNDTIYDQQSIAAASCLTIYWQPN